jgi:hypothetical protein
LQARLLLLIRKHLTGALLTGKGLTGMNLFDDLVDVGIHRQD